MIVFLTVSFHDDVRMQENPLEQSGTIGLLFRYAKICRIKALKKFNFETLYSVGISVEEGASLLLTSLKNHSPEEIPEANGVLDEIAQAPEIMEEATVIKEPAAEIMQTDAAEAEPSDASAALFG